MGDLLSIIAPVFLVIGAGYLLVRLKYFTDSHMDGLMVFTQGFAFPCMLFRATSSLDLAQVFDLRLLGSYYVGATLAFVLGIIGARTIFRRRPGEAVAVGFGALFANTVMLGLPIMERAFGPAELDAAIAIVSIHAPFCYALGITVMEVSRADGAGAAATARRIARAMFRNALMIGIALGYAVNLLGLPVPQVLGDALDLIVRAALPAALIAVGGVLTRYRIERALGEASMTSILSLLVRPVIVWLLATKVFDLSESFTRAAVLLAAMPPGVNTYIFASLYNRAVGAAASTLVLAATVSILSVSVWLAILGAGG